SPPFSHHDVLLCFFYCYADHRHLHSFPTRRSSDLGSCRIVEMNCNFCCIPFDSSSMRRSRQAARPSRSSHAVALARAEATAWLRSEEHTSELQSRGHLVCRLLLEKKKKTQTN